MLDSSKHGQRARGTLRVQGDFKSKRDFREILRHSRAIARSLLLAFGVTKDLAIFDVARAFGLRTSTIRYSEQIGILPPPFRKNGQRRYDDSVLFRLAVGAARSRDAVHPG